MAMAVAVAVAVAPEGATAGTPTAASLPVAVATMLTAGALPVAVASLQAPVPQSMFSNEDLGVLADTLQTTQPGFWKAPSIEIEGAAGPCMSGSAEMTIHPLAANKYKTTSRTKVSCCLCIPFNITGDGAIEENGTGWTMATSDGARFVGTLTSIDATRRVVTYAVTGTAPVHGGAVAGNQEIDGKGRTNTIFWEDGRMSIKAVYTKTTGGV